jgi:hypothetical protein
VDIGHDMVRYELLTKIGQTLSSTSLFGGLAS